MVEVSPVSHGPDQAGRPSRHVELCQKGASGEPLRRPGQASLNRILDPGGRRSGVAALGLCKPRKLVSDPAQAGGP